MKFKLKKHSLTCLLLFLATGEKLYKYSIDGNTTQNLNRSRGIKRLENKYLKEQHLGQWSTAVLYCMQTKQPLQYYHNQTGLQPLDKNQFASLMQQEQKQLQQYNLYIVPNHKAREQGQHKGRRVKNVALQDVDLYWNDYTAKINLYKGSSLCFVYQGKGQFKSV